MKNRYTQEELDETIVFYCTRCCSLKILKGKKIRGSDAHVLYCGDCGAGPKYIDITNIGKFWTLFKQRTGHHYLAPEPTKYDDIQEVYEGETEEIITESEALTNGMHVRDVINLKITE